MRWHSGRSVTQTIIADGCTSRGVSSGARGVARLQRRRSCVLKTSLMSLPHHAVSLLPMMRERRRSLPGTKLSALITNATLELVSVKG